jgi:hypothetical protein
MLLTRVLHDCAPSISRPVWGVIASYLEPSEICYTVDWMQLRCVVKKNGAVRKVRSRVTAVESHNQHRGMTAVTANGAVFRWYVGPRSPCQPTYKQCMANYVELMAASSVVVRNQSVCWMDSTYHSREPRVDAKTVTKIIKGRLLAYDPVSNLLYVHCYGEWHNEQFVCVYDEKKKLEVRKCSGVGAAEALAVYDGDIWLVYRHKPYGGLPRRVIKNNQRRYRNYQDRTVDWVTTLTRPDKKQAYELPGVRGVTHLTVNAWHVFAGHDHCVTVFSRDESPRQLCVFHVWALRLNDPIRSLCITDDRLFVGSQCGSIVVCQLRQCLNPH